MRLECPHCHAVFEVPQALLDHARRLRCANCGESWDAEASAAMPDEEGHGVEDAVASLAEPDEGTEPGAGPLKQQSAGVCSLAAREIERRQSVLHSRAPVGPVAASAAPVRHMIGSTGSWLAAWGVSLVMVGCGAVAVWHWKAGEVSHLWPGVGHFVSP
ncbi:hypothetical protein BAR24_15340 [Gluconobacter oxydans]|uniref:zinc-ribbon domain-containing protein n=1 Tax=Gluconobacter thailandicus TaxID=257438 RepID=UPI00030C05B3|nr:zinc-ribbon domain-containing protein [Gluconobacter thailandicus]ANQ42697.1 hypothetical protein BAR24_15340 [Gluconobacter oxydans]